MECLDNIIGLSQTNCDCLLDKLPSGSDEAGDFSESKSNIFLDELDGFNVNFLADVESCSRGTLWDIMDRARRTAIQDFKTNLLGCIGATYKPRLQNFKFQLGESTFKSTLDKSFGAYAGMRITPAQIKGGFIYLNKIGILINQNAPVTLRVYSNENGGTLLFTSNPVDAIANTLTWGVLSSPLELKMWSYSVDIIRYYVVMDMDGTFKPKANKKDCGCANKAKPYDKWIDLSGVDGTNTDNMNSFTVNSTYLNGIVADVDVKCKTSEVICSDEYPPDYENDPGAANMAVAIRFRAGARCYEELLSSDQINKTTLMRREEIRSYIDKWNTEFQNWIKYLCENFNPDVNDCLICRDTNKSFHAHKILR